MQWRQRNTVLGEPLAELAAAWLERVGLAEGDLPGGLGQAAHREQLARQRESRSEAAQVRAAIEGAALLVHRAHEGVPQRKTTA